MAEEEAEAEAEEELLHNHHRKLHVYSDLHFIDSMTMTQKAYTQIHTPIYYYEQQKNSMQAAVQGMASNAASSAGSAAASGAASGYVYLFSNLLSPSSDLIDFTFLLYARQ